ncbi:SIS domain-containing protein [Nonomuraea sp. B12E4]|uniref:SIS domain-containing protein n=1 Tax=Nonomuraea sp. B12E4 TaxID=3153564 RepID=UPI00325D5951
MNPEVLIRQAARLADDLREFAGLFARRAGDLLSGPERASIGQVYLVGQGDSYHAACAAEPAFASIGGVPGRAAGAFRFSAYDSRWAHRGGAGRTLVVAASASGRTPAVLAALERARDAGALTVAVTGTPGSPVTGAAERVLAVDLPGQEPSPGVRTYQASLLGMLLIAVRLGGAEALHGELAALAGPVAATHEATGPRARAEAEHAAGSPGAAVLGSGPNHGTAMFAAAKLVESAGLPAVGQDLEEWAHVERWARPRDTPVYVLAPPGHAHGHAGAIAARARELGKRVVVVAERGDAAATRAAHATFEVAGRAREEFSPFLYHVFAVHLAARVAQRLGRRPFQSRPEENH